MSKFKKIFTTAAVIGASAALTAGVAHADVIKSGSSYYGSCDNHVGGHLGYSSTYGGNIFISDASGGAGCNATYLETVYYDGSGNEVAVYDTSSQPLGGSGTYAKHLLTPGQFRSIVEVVGSSQDFHGNSTGGVYLYF